MCTRVHIRTIFELAACVITQFGLERAGPKAEMRRVTGKKTKLATAVVSQAPTTSLTRVSLRPRPPAGNKISGWATT